MTEIGELAEILDRPAGRFRLVDRLNRLIERYAWNQPLVIALDDAHWADELSALALRVLVPALRTVPVLWLFARRPLPVNSPAQDVLASLIDEGAHRHSLDPLSDAAAAELSAHVLSAVSEASNDHDICR